MRIAWGSLDFNWSVTIYTRMKTSELITEIVHEAAMGIGGSGTVLSQPIQVNIRIDRNGEPTHKNEVATLNLLVFPKAKPPPEK